MVNAHKYIPLTLNRQLIVIGLKVKRYALTRMAHSFCYKDDECMFVQYTHCVCFGQLVDCVAYAWRFLCNHSTYRSRFCCCRSSLLPLNSNAVCIRRRQCRIKASSIVIPFCLLHAATMLIVTITQCGYDDESSDHVITQTFATVATVSVLHATLMKIEQCKQRVNFEIILSSTK